MYCQYILIVIPVAAGILPVLVFRKAVRRCCVFASSSLALNILMATPTTD